ncbi:MAG: DEAD/DEAH box helicase family protein [Marinobacter sp.]|uniref:DEAD/DEAH box helicase n=1 Tax=Marinobacter sp. TaxID=50741 RepID=UPI001B5DC536|nr:DEAD/DEAH box helicase family protein [Marinobacter sp.]MBQ0748504.1 DEAD/DEAH box helicase family protein [Marinobacter sp.]MBQ0815964.1 DEAD/DEAH box helicase family protein [Marinobacter sp.]
MRQLRIWQSECIAQALSSFESQSHFLCHATPAAGKTVMVASVAKTLFERDKIDFVICFSPSRAVAQSVATTFSQVLGKSFNGKIGAAGGSYTYQSMSTLPKELWQVLSDHRVLVVLDEIHHCSGSGSDDFIIGNSWGKTILDRIQGNASYSIALSGTPWRTDDTPIALARYTQPDGELHCDYEYGLRRAVSDGVCREPKIVLTDNREIHLSSSEHGLQTYSSIRDTIEHGHISYPDFLFRDEVIDHTLSEGSKKLSEIRQHIPNAGGLVVAATVAHAEHIATRLAELGESSVVASCRTPDAHQTINYFRASTNRWIISVGMISEGTDIPRLQVCCHLSRIRTELHFRQVLGRILRRQADEPSDIGGWLYVLAEQNLTEFARRIGEDLPEQTVVSFSPITPKQNSDGLIGRTALARDTDTAERDIEFDVGGTWDAEKGLVPPSESAELTISNHYWNEILSLFEGQVV